MHKFKEGDRFVTEIIKIEPCLNTRNYLVEIGGYYTWFTEDNLDKCKRYMPSDIAEQVWKFVKELCPMETEEAQEAFDGQSDLWGVINEFSYEEAKERFENWKNRVCVGDEVVMAVGSLPYHYIVTSVTNDRVEIMDESGGFGTTFRKGIKKTGRHVDLTPIFDLLKDNKTGRKEK